MQTSSNESIHWQLFKSVRPLFASAIPWEVQQNSRDDVSADIAIENTGDLIRACMAEIPIHVRMEQFHTLDEFALFIADDLRPFLFALQELVHDNVMEYVDTSVVSKAIALLNQSIEPYLEVSKTPDIELQMNYADQKLLKLNALGHMLQSSTAGVFDVETYQKFLCLNQDPSHLRKILINVENFNKRLVAEMNKIGLDRSAVPKSSTTSRPSSDNASPWLQTAFSHSFWRASHNLFEVLVRNVSSCKSSTHSAMLNLKGLKPPIPQDNAAEFEMLLPLCTEQGSWQETSCRVLYKSRSESDAEDDMLPENICQAVQVANNYGVMFHIRVHEENLSYHYCDDQQPKYPKAIPTTTISQLIECGFLKDLRGFHLKDRWILALNLAQSLLQLHNGPWIQTLWTSDKLFFLCEDPEEGRKLCNVHSPFISCIISDSPPTLSKPSHFDRYPLLLTFGQFLLELANGERFPVTRTRAGDFSPYKTLMDNFTEMNAGSLSNDYREAIEGCLKFQKFLKDEKDPDEEVRIRTAIFKRIVQPLERNLRLYSKVPVSADISITRTEEKKLALDTLGTRDLHLKGDNVLATLQDLGPLPLRPRHSPDVGIRAAGQGERKEPENYKLPALEFSNSYAACGSQLGKDICRIVAVPTRENLFLESPEAEAKVAVRRSSTTVAIQRQQHYHEQSDNSDCSPSSEPEFDEASGRLLGTFDLEDSETKTSGSMEWGRTFRTLSRIYGSRFQHMPSDTPVKVAILDTGIDRDHPDFQDPRSKPKSDGMISPVNGEEGQIKRIKACQNFCDDRKDAEDVTDIDGHGTHVAGIILQLAPKAELYIARVCQGDESYGRDSPTLGAKVPSGKLKQLADAKKVHPGRVERAIAWAIEHEVHLINMSFGYKNWDPKLDQALKRARDHGIIIFAAASNLGNHEQVAWPARDPERAICVHSSIDLGTDSSKFTPKAHPSTINFMVVGERICSHWPVHKGGGFRTMSGTSTATPVATAIAALLLAFTRQDVVNKETKTDVETEVGPVTLQELWSMRALLKHICTKVENYYWIRPHLLWSQSKQSRLQEDPSVGSKDAWEEIRRALRR